LLMSFDTKSGAISEADATQLREEITDQMMELTLLVGELVDRARVDESTLGRGDSL
jgi:two-component system sensor histidine kinase MprB